MTEVQVKHFPIRVGQTNKNEHLQVLLLKLRNWKPEEINIESLSGGYVNEIVKCSNKKKTEEPVVIRIWADENIPSVSRVTELDCVKILSDVGCFPTLYSTFDNGYCYQFYQSERFKYNPIDDRLVSAFTKGLALFHATEVPKLNKTSSFRDDITEKFNDMNENEWEVTKRMKYGCNFPTKCEFQKMFNSAMDMVTNLGSPIVLCHGDCHFKNCLWNFKDDHVIFVDCELTKYNHQAFDIAYHFYSYRFHQVFGEDISPKDEDAYQRQWIRKYLNAWFKICGKLEEPTEQDCNRVHVQVKKYTLVISMWITFIILIMKQSQLKDLDLPQMGLEAYEFYQKHCEEYTNLPLPDN